MTIQLRCGYHFQAGPCACRGWVVGGWMSGWGGNNVTRSVGRQASSKSRVPHPTPDIQHPKLGGHAGESMGKTVFMGGRVWEDCWFGEWIDMQNSVWAYGQCAG